MRPQSTPEQRFWSKVDRSGECWLWRGRCDKDGYGRFDIAKRAWTTTHRFAWTQAHGTIPPDLQVLHTCDTPSCVNPSHLFLGTPAINAADKVAKGRQAKGGKTRRKTALHGEAMPSAKLTERDVCTIRALLSGGHTIAGIAREYHVSTTTIWQIKNRAKWRHVA